MAKKYLLYIHDDEQFDKEPNKSGLVNELLGTYWEPRLSDIKPDTPVIEYEDSKAMNEPGAVTPAIKASERFAFCKHEQVKGFCKHGCK